MSSRRRVLASLLGRPRRTSSRLHFSACIRSHRFFAGTGGTASAAHLTGLTKEDWKNGGFSEYQRVKGDESTTFKNQGDCIQFVNTGK
jgi:hypothetical protein